MSTLLIVQVKLDVHGIALHQLVVFLVHHYHLQIVLLHNGAIGIQLHAIHLMYVQNYMEHQQIHVHHNNHHALYQQILQLLM